MILTMDHKTSFIRLFADAWQTPHFGKSIAIFEVADILGQANYKTFHPKM